MANRVMGVSYPEYRDIAIRILHSAFLAGGPYRGHPLAVHGEDSFEIEHVPKRRGGSNRAWEERRS